jgi:hypothetical protein
MIDINKEAREYALTKSSSGQFINTHIRDFMAGVNSKHVQAKILQAQIKLSIHYMNNTNDADTLFFIGEQVTQLRQQLKDLENENQTT